MHLSARFNTAIIISISIDARGKLVPPSSGFISKTTLHDSTKHTHNPTHADRAWLERPKGINMI